MTCGHAEAGQNAAVPSRVKSRILELAADLFYREGFHAVGVDRIVAGAGTTKTTFYRHFESKDALILQVLADNERWWQRTFAALLAERGGPTPLGQLRAVFDVLDELVATRLFNGCMFVNVSVEFPRRHDPVHRAAAEHRRAMEALVRDLAVRAGLRDPVAFAAQLALLMDASFLSRQIDEPERPADAARHLGALLLAEHAPADA